MRGRNIASFLNLFDHTKGMEETRIVQVAGGVVLNAKGSVVIVNQNGDSWSLPKGHVDDGEDLLICAKREIHEESGIPAYALRYVRELGSYERYRIGLDGGDDVTEKKMITMFLFTTTWDKELKPYDPQNPQAKWVKQEQVASILTHPKDKAFFLAIRDQLT